MRTHFLTVTVAILSMGHAARLHAEPVVADFSHAPSRQAMRAVLQMHGVPAPSDTQLQAPLVPFAEVPALSAMNVRVNDPSLDTPERTTQSETSLAVLGSTVCAAYNDTAGRTAISGFSRSDNGGTTWGVQGLNGQFQFGDPALGVHRASGTFYYGEIAYLGDRSPSGSLRTSVGVARSTDDCTSFPSVANASPDVAPATVCLGPNTRQCASCARNADCDSRLGAGDGVCTAADAQDKPWIAVDNSGGSRDGYVYACWSRFVNEFGPGSASSAQIRFSRSTDGGMSFTDVQTISTSADEFPIGCHIEVGPDGSVDLVWANRNAGASFPIIFRRSMDGGLSWGPRVQVNTLPIRHPGIDRVVTCGSQPVCGIPMLVPLTTLNGNIRMVSQAWMAVDGTDGPFRGNIYVVWASDPPGLIDNSDIYLSRSTDGGSTWSSDMQIAGGSVTDQFEPFVAVGGSGTVSIAWYDRRNDPANNLIDVYTTFSRDGGATLEPIVRVTDVSFPVPPLTGQPTQTGNFDPSASACYMGEYIAVAGDTDNFYYAWGDNRDRVVSTTYPNGRPDPDVYFDRLPVLPIVPPCIGDCDGDGTVTLNELLTLVNIALGNLPLSACGAADGNGDGKLIINDIVIAVNNAMNGCA
jgi:hypothetical protein